MLKGRNNTKRDQKQEPKVPVRADCEPRVTVSFRLLPEIISAIDRLAGQDGRSRNNMVERLLASALNGNLKDPNGTETLHRNAPALETR